MSLKPLHAVAFASVALGALVASSGRAEADPAPPSQSAAPMTEKAMCVKRLDLAQAQESAKKLRASRTSFLACAAEACPDLVREDCARSLVELDGAIPTAVFSATVDGVDTDNVRILVDGELTTEHLDGHAISVDPGAHVARFIVQGRTPQEVRFVAREGEKNRIVGATFGNPKLAVAAAADKRAEGGKGIPILPMVLAGVGVISLGGALGFRLQAESDADAYRRTCAPSCDPSARDELSGKLVASNISLAIGVGALAASAIAWVIDSTHH